MLDSDESDDDMTYDDGVYVGYIGIQQYTYI
jgi:hypothetical protein